MHGLLFTSDFLREGIRQTLGWMSAENEFQVFRESIRSLYTTLAHPGGLNEADTESEVIEPVLDALGWTDRSRQTNTSSSGRQDVPDFLLFASAEAKRAGRADKREDRRYRRPAVRVGSGRPPSPHRSPRCAVLPVVWSRSRRGGVRAGYLPDRPGTGRTRLWPLPTKELVLGYMNALTAGDTKSVLSA